MEKNRLVAEGDFFRGRTSFQMKETVDHVRHLSVAQYSRQLRADTFAFAFALKFIILLGMVSFFY